jgi:hypothetical protein
MQSCDHPGSPGRKCIPTSNPPGGGKLRDFRKELFLAWEGLTVSRRSMEPDAAVSACCSRLDPSTIPLQGNDISRTPLGMPKQRGSARALLWPDQPTPPDRK